MFDPAYRVLLQALLFSLLAHVLLLIGPGPFPPPVFEAPARALQAVVHAPRDAPAAKVAAAGPSPRSAETPDARPRRPVAPRRVANPANPANPVAAAVLPAASGDAAPAPAAGAVSETGESVPAAAVGAAAPPAPPPAPPAAPALSPDDLRQYRLDLAVQARRFRRYPAVARERGQEGRVEIEIGASARLPLPQVSLHASSGHAALDEQALAMVRQATQAAPLPAGLRGRDFRLVVPVLFSLDAAQ